MLLRIVTSLALIITLTLGEQTNKKGEAQNSEEQPGVHISLEKYTELYRRAYLANATRSKEIDRLAADVETLTEKRKKQREQHSTEIEMLRRRYTKKWIERNVKSDTPTWLQPSDVDLTETKSSNWVPLHSVLSGSWNHSAGPSSPAIFTVEVYFRLFSKKWTAVPLLHAGTVASDWEVGFAPEDGVDTDVLLEMMDRDLYTLKSDNPFGDMTLTEEDRKRLDDEFAAKIAGWKGWSSPEQPASQLSPTAGSSIYEDIRSASFRSLKSTDAMLHTARYSDASTPEPQQTHVLSCHHAGLYRVKFSAYATVRSLSKIKQDAYSLSLSNLFFAVGDLDLKVLYNTSTGDGIHDFSTTPLGYHQVEKGPDGDVIRMKLPVTRNVDMKWRKSVPPAPAPEPEKRETDTGKNKTNRPEPQQATLISPVTVRHDALHSVEEGNLLQSTHFVKYTLDSEQASFTETTIRLYPKNSRVTSVVGHGLSTWSVRQGGKNDSHSVLSLSFGSGIADTLIVQIGIEMEYSDESVHISIPKIVCENIIRQTGFYGISKAPNIELHQKSLPRGMSKVSVKDLSESLRFKASSGPPLVMAYKYLSTSALVTDKKNAMDPELILTVRSHEQMVILDAIVENAFYKEIVMENGRSVHKLILIVQNTKEQYLKLHNLPSSLKVWSLNVNSVGVKPVMMGDQSSKSGKSLLIPLLVGLPSDLSNRRTAPKTSVEIVYASENNFLTQKTEAVGPTRAYQSGVTHEETVRIMSLTPPLIEAIPIEYLSVLILFPEGYDTVFSSSPKKNTTNLADELAYFVQNAALPGSSSDITGPLKRGFLKKPPTPISHKKGKTVVPNEYKFGDHDDAVGGDAGSEGLNIEFEDTGVASRFQRTLLENEQATLNVAYQLSPEKKAPPPPPLTWWETLLLQITSRMFSRSD